MDKEFIGVILFFNCIAVGISLLTSEDTREGLIGGCICGFFITMLCVAVYLMTGGR